jgi:hypothetical protein
LLVWTLRAGSHDAAHYGGRLWAREAANIIKIRQNNFDEMLKLLPIEIQGVQLEKSGIPDESKMKTCSAKRLAQPIGSNQDN